MSKHLINSRGGALLIVLSIMLMLTIGALVAVDTAQRDIDLSFNQLHYDQAFYVAEAGIKEAIYQLNLDNEFNTPLDSVTFANGMYTVVFEHSNIDIAVQDTVLVRATAWVQNAYANIDAWVTPELLFPFDYAVYGDEFVLMDQNTCTGSYDSRIDPDPDAYDVTDGDVASNGTITLDNSALVGGDISSALDDGVTVCPTCSVSTDVNVGVDSVELKPVDEFPTVYWDPPEDGITGTYTLDSDELGGDSLTIGSNSTVTLAPGTYIFTDIVLEENSTLSVSPSVIIYMDGDLLLSNNTTVNPDQAAADLLIYSTGSIETLGNDVDIHAAFYGPEADVYLANSCDFYGSIVSNSVTMENTGCVYYDRALAEVPNETTGNMIMSAWKEK